MVYCTRLVILSPSLCFVVVFFRPFSVALTSLGEENGGLCAFRRAFVLFCACWFVSLLHIGVRCWLRFVIVVVDFSFYRFTLFVHV